MFALGRQVECALSYRLPYLLVTISMVIAAACGSVSEDTVDRACAGLEAVTEHAGLLSRSEAEGVATKRLAMSAPEVTGVEVERVWSSCLTTFRSYEQDLLNRQVWTNPDVWPPEMPVWVVEVKGISRPAGISASNTGDPYKFAMAVMDARSGESIAGSRYLEPLLASTQGE